MQLSSVSPYLGNSALSEEQKKVISDKTVYACKFFRVLCMADHPITALFQRLTKLWVIAEVDRVNVMQDSINAEFLIDSDPVPYHILLMFNRLTTEIFVESLKGQLEERQFIKIKKVFCEQLSWINPTSSLGDVFRELNPNFDQDFKSLTHFFSISLVTEIKPSDSWKGLTPAASWKGLTPASYPKPIPILPCSYLTDSSFKSSTAAPSSQVVTRKSKKRDKWCPCAIPPTSITTSSTPTPNFQALLGSPKSYTFIQMRNEIKAQPGQKRKAAEIETVDPRISLETKNQKVNEESLGTAVSQNPSLQPDEVFDVSNLLDQFGDLFEQIEVDDLLNLN